VNAHGILAQGPWAPELVVPTWRDELYEPPPEVSARADEAVADLERRGSPSHDGRAARLTSFDASPERLALELQPARWALRLVDGAAADALTVLCAVRREDGSWLAGRRAQWLASWAGRWALGAGGAVEVGEDPAVAMARELEEEWSLVPVTRTIEALLRLPNGLTMLVGMARVPQDAEPVPDAEHDEWAWWPSDVDEWPDEADPRVKAAGRLLATGQ
jgi:ADP-ribose pyrophosphatase YjhB (NUDIX family)